MSHAAFKKETDLQYGGGAYVGSGGDGNGGVGGGAGHLHPGEGERPSPPAGPPQVAVGPVVVPARHLQGCNNTVSSLFFFFKVMNSSTIFSQQF